MGNPEIKEMKELLKEMHSWMDAYMKSFHTDDEEVMQGIRIKELHTGYVTSIAVQLAKHLQLSEHDAQLAEIMGLFHDVGRFHQYSLYKTFNDAESEDHADLGLKVLSELDFMKKLALGDEALVRFAIGRHNKKEIGPAPSEKALLFAKLLRDADKLDIYRVLSPFLGPARTRRRSSSPRMRVSSSVPISSRRSKKGGRRITASCARMVIASSCACSGSMTSTSAGRSARLSSAATSTASSTTCRTSRAWRRASRACAPMWRSGVRRWTK